MLYFNFKTPLVSDDYDYLYIFNGTLEDSTHRVESISDIFVSLKDHYKWFNGRLVDHFFVQLMMLCGKGVFNVINSVFYLLLGAVIYFLANGREKPRLGLFVFIEFLLFFFPSVWGETFLWLAGSCNYLWSALIALSYLLVFRMRLDSDSPKRGVAAAVPMFLFGFLAGWTNENLAPAVIASSVLFLILFKLCKIKLPVWGFTGLAGNILGFLPLINYSIVSLKNDNTSSLSFLSGFAGKLYPITVSFLKESAVLSAVCVILFFTACSFISFKSRKTGIIFIFTVFSFISLYICAAAKAYESRNFFFSQIALIVSAAVAASGIDYSVPALRKAAVGAFCIMFTAAVPGILNAYFEIKTFDALWNSRVQYIEQQKQIGNKELVFEIFEPEDRHCAVYKLRDIVRQAEGWPNISMAKYYGVEKIYGYKASDKSVFESIDSNEKIKQTIIN